MITIIFMNKVSHLDNPNRRQLGSVWGLWLRKCKERWSFQRGAFHSREFTCSHVDDSQICTSVPTLLLRVQGPISIAYCSSLLGYFTTNSHSTYAKPHTYFLNECLHGIRFWNHHLPLFTLVSLCSDMWPCDLV